MNRISLLHVPLLSIILCACSVSKPAATVAETDCLAPYRSGKLTEYTLYQIDAQDFPVFPKGVEPVYDIVFARHGSRYLDGRDSYSAMMGLLAEAENNRCLTAKGEALLNWYRLIYPAVKGHEGQLTQKGREQHRSISQSIGRWLHPLFAAKPNVRIATSTTQRVIDSQESFVDGLTRVHPNVQGIGPVDTTEILHVHNRWDLEEPCAGIYNQYQKSRIDIPEFIGRFFTQPDLPARYFGDSYNFIRVLRNLLADLYSLDQEIPDGWQEILNDGDYAAIHDIQSTYTQLLLGRSGISDNYGLNWYRDTWQWIADNTRADLATDSIAAGLYFSHDILIDNLLAVLQIESFGDDTAPIEAIAASYPLSAVPMASNLQLCICRDHQTGELVVYPLLNGRSAKVKGLRQMRQGAYRWSEVENRMRFF